MTEVFCFSFFRIPVKNKKNIDNFTSGFGGNQTWALQNFNK
jgi:hypothetical protein